MIGVYDSGFGGLSVLRELLPALPDHDFLYLGDNGRAPYGGRDPDVLLDLSEQCVERLFDEGCRLIVVACHTVSTVALRHLQRHYCPPSGDRRILGVTIPAAEAAVAVTRGHVGLIGTAATVHAGTFGVEVHKLSPETTVSAVAAPLLAPLVEEGWEDTEIARAAIRRYLDALPLHPSAERGGVDTLVLGCTHYPLLRAAFEAVLPPHVQLLDPGPAVAVRLKQWLKRHPTFVTPTTRAAGEDRLRVLCTGSPESFRKHGSRFLGREIREVETVGETAGRLLPRDAQSTPKGQIVRPHRRGRAER